MKYVAGAIFFFVAAVVLVWLLSRGARQTSPTSVPPGVTVYQSGVLGVVKSGPTCPVERDPPDPQCADKPYVTTVVARRADGSAPDTSVRTDADGAFHLALPPGDYNISALGGSPLPRCTGVSVTVPAVGYVNADIMCDTGIR